MSWLTEYVRPKIRTLFARREVPENLWRQCPECQQMIFHTDLDKNLKVCPHCGHHMRGTRARALAWTFDEGSWTRIELPKVPADPLRFRDGKRYRRPAARGARQDHASGGRAGRSRTARSAATARWSRPWRSSSWRGRWAPRSARAIVAAARLAVLQDAPLIVFTASGGARMQEGAISLMQMPRTVIATRLVKEAGLPFIVVLTDPTTGGVTASFAMLGDIQIAEPGAMIGFAGARVIEQTVREKLPEGFQRAEYLHEHGIVDMVVKRTELQATRSPA